MSSAPIIWRKQGEAAQTLFSEGGCPSLPYYPRQKRTRRLAPPTETDHVSTSEVSTCYLPGYRGRRISIWRKVFSDAVLANKYIRKATRGRVRAVDSRIKVILIKTPKRKARSVSLSLDSQLKKIFCLGHSMYLSVPQTLIIFDLLFLSARFSFSFLQGLVPPHEPPPLYTPFLPLGGTLFYQS